LSPPKSEGPSMHPIHKLLLTALRRVPKRVVKPVAMRYIAGEGLEDAVRVVRGLNAGNMTATIDVLGEDVSTREEAEQARESCARVLKTVQEERLNSNLSIKLTQFGLKVDGRLCYENVKKILEIARGYGNFVRMDMEDSSTTDSTLNLYERLRAEGFENVGVVIQAYLRRSEADVRKLIRAGAKVRIVKGIYVEPEAIAFKDREEIRRNYLKLLKMLLEARCFVAIATHDDFLVKGASQFIREMNLPANAYEFQMLYGVRVKLRDQILARGHRMRIYVPFGAHWYAYSMRRFQENPQMVRYILQALLVEN
jgi:proline dehydrogenase